MPDSADAAREVALEASLLRGRHLGPVHRVRRLRDRVPARRARLPRRPRASTSRSSSRTASRPTTAATARRAARRAPGRARGSAPGSPRSTSSCSAGPATAEEPSGIYKDIVLARATDPVLAEVGQDGGLVSALLVYALEHDMIDAALVSYLEGDGTTWKAIPGVARTRRTSSPRPGAATRTRRTRMAYADAIESGAERIALVGMSCQSSVPPVMKQRKAGKVARRLVAQHRPAVLEDVRRRDLRGALRGEVRPEEGRHEEDEHQGRLPDLDAQRRLPRGAAQGVPRVDARGLQDVPRLRRRARRHLHRRHRRVQRLDAHHRAHRRSAAS